MVDKMTAADVREALLGRWPPDQYLSIYEAPTSSDRQGRKLDVVVVSLWRSRGLQMDGVEIKISMSDWKRELDDPDKADWWHQRVHRFWIAAPADVAKKIRPQLPVNWGLLSCGESGVRALVTPEPNRNPTPLEWGSTVGLLRATADCGVNLLRREWQKGYDQGLKAAEERAEREGHDHVSAAKLNHLQYEYDRLRTAVDDFEAASGVRIPRYQASRIGDAVALVLEAMGQGPTVLDNRLATQAAQLRSIADGVDQVRAAVTPLAQPAQPTLEEAS